MAATHELHMQHVMLDVATLLRVSPERLEAMLSHCGTLSAVAANAGISEWKLTDTIKQALVDGGAPAGAGEIDELAVRVARQRFGRAAGGRNQAVAEAAQLRLSPSTWRRSLRDM